MENIELLEGEYFIPLKDFEKTYQISNFGRVYSNYTKNLMKSIKDGDRYILIIKKNLQKKLHIYDMYFSTFGELLFKWYTQNINYSKIKNIEGEIWKPIKNYENYYEISNFGRVKSCIRNTKTWKIRKESILKPHKSEYIQVKLTKNGKSKMPLLHRLVAEAFINNPNPEYYNVVNHIDFNKLNNSIENLEWCSHSMNIKHTYNAGRSKSIQNGRSKSKINFEIAEEIRKFTKENNHLSQREIGLNFGVSREIVKDIINYKSWKTK